MDKEHTATPQFVFVSYSRANKEFVERLVSDLQARGVNCWIDQQGLKPGIPDWEQVLRDAIRSSQAVLLAASRESRQSRFVKAELDVAEMYRRAVFPVWVAGEQWIDSIPMGLSVAQFIDARGERYQAALNEIVATVGAGETAFLVAAESDESDPAVAPRNPYKGLRAFHEADAGDFFGRTRVTAELVEALRETLVSDTEGAGRLLAVVGPSGSGKSSVAMAGLVPRLKAGALPGSADWVYLDAMTPGSHPLEALTVTLAGRLDRSMSSMRHDLDDDSARGLHLLASRLATRPGTLVAGTSMAGTAVAGTRLPATRVALLIDQFEELFTQTAGEDERRQFIDLLVAAVTEPHGPVVLVLTMRADFYHQTMRYADLWRLVEPRTHYIAPLSVEELREVIEGPAGLADTRLRFEGDLVGDLLFEVREQAGALPLLQFALDQLFQHREGRRLTVAAYRHLGGVRGALARHAEETFGSLPSEEHRLLARALFLRLIEPGAGEGAATRRRVDMAELTLPDAAQTTVLRATTAAFVTARLLFANEIAGATTLDVSHEALVTGWPRLQGWIDEDRAGLLLHRGLTEAAGEWQRLGRDEGALYRGARLAAAAEWAAGAPGALNQLEAAFLRASQALQARERQAAQRRVRRTIGGLLAGLVSIGVVAVVAVVQWRAAVQAQEAARQAQRLATSRELAANATAQLRVDPELALLLARQAALVAPTTEARNALRQALLQAHLRAAFRGHVGPVNSVALSPVGVRAVTAGDDGTAQIWDARTERVLHVLRVNGVRLRAAAFSPDGRLVVTAGDDGAARLWNASSGTMLRALCRHRDRVTSAAFSPNGRLVVTASDDGTAQVCVATTGHSLRLLGRVTIGRGMTGAAFSPDGTRIVTADKDGTAQVWDAATGRSVRVLGQVASDVTVNSAAYSPNGLLIVTASADNTAALWDASSGRRLRLLAGHTKPVTGAVFSRDSRLVVTASADNTAQVWDAATGHNLAVLRGHTDTVTGAVFSPDGRSIVTASADGTARVWDTLTQDRLSLLLWHGAGVTSAAFSPDGTRVLTGHRDDTARIWQAQTGRLLQTLRGHTGPVTGVSASPDGKLVLTVSDDGTAGLWDAATGRRLHSLNGQVTSAAFSPDGARVVTAGGDSAVQVWDTGTGKVLRALNQPVAGPGAGMTAAMFSPDGTLVAALDTNETAHVWDARTGAPLATPANTVGGISFSPDGSLLLRVTTAGTAQACRVRSCVFLPGLAFGAGVTSAAFSPGGALLATGNRDNTADIWQIAPRNHLATLSGHTGPVSSVAFSPDGRFVVTGSNDGTARVWDGETNLAILQGRAGDAAGGAFSRADSVTAASFSRAGRLVLATRADGTLRLYSCAICGSLDDLMALAAQRATRQLTAQERARYLHTGD